MSCNFITAGRQLGCKDSVSGLKNVFFIKYSDLDEANVSFDSTNTDELKTWTPATQLSMYKYELKGANSFETEIVSSRENGTTFFKGALNIQLKKQDVATHKAVKLLSFDRPRIVIQTMTNQFFLMGLAQGSDVVGGTISSGESLDSFNGYTLNFECEEVLPSPFMQCTTEAELKVLFNTVNDGSGDDALIVAS